MRRRDTLDELRDCGESSRFPPEPQRRCRYTTGDAVERPFRCILAELAGHAVDSEDNGV